jgi:outer membrane lipoprotein SlyB
MKRLMSLASAVAVAASVISVPQLASAQAYKSYGRGDICRAEQKSSANKGTIIGALGGALLGSQVAGNGAKTEGAVLGAGLGAVAGHQIGKSRVKCVDYPKSYSSRDNCRWIQEDNRGRNRSFEVCQDRDGEWRPSGRR